MARFMARFINSLLFFIFFFFNKTKLLYFTDLHEASKTLSAFFGKFSSVKNIVMWYFSLDLSLKIFRYSAKIL